MAGEVGTQVRDLLSANEAHLLEPWVAAAVGPARARVAPDELRRNCRGLLRALTAAVEEGELDVRAEPYAGCGQGSPRCPVSVLGADSPRARPRPRCSP